MSGSTAQRATRRPPHLPFIAGEILLLILFGALTLTVKQHPGPLSGDVGLEQDVQRALLPHAALRDPLEAISALNFPTPTIITLAVIVALFLVLRRWLDAIVVPVAAGVESGTVYELGTWAHRPRPTDHGLTIVQRLHSFSFPSGHVTYAVAVFGLFLFLTFQVRRAIHPALVWTLRVILILLIVLMPISRVLEGEHWPSDTLGGALAGLFWLAIFAHLYLWLRSREPGLLAPDER